MRISRQQFPVKFMMDQEQLENVEFLNIYVSCSQMIEDTLVKLISRISMAKAASNKKRALFSGKLDLELRKKLVKCCIWSMVLYGANTSMLRAVYKKTANFLNVLLKMDGEDQLDRTCEK
jgi:hypothetical protein